MMTLGAISLTCWLCTLLAAPRKPRRGNEIEELVYSRLLGRQQMLRLLAFVVTAGMLFALIFAARPDRVDPDMQRVRPVCQDFPNGNAVCNIMQQDGQLTKVVYSRGNNT
jgi:hypothetical protein